MEFKSVWQGNRREYPPLKGDIEREIVVIGGGIAGFLTALRLWEKGKQVTLIEADRLFSGTTGKTTAKISVNQQTVYADLFDRYDEDTAKLYFRSQREGQAGFVELAQKYGTGGDFVETSSYIFTDGVCKRLKENHALLKSFGAQCEFIDGAPVVGAKYALRVDGEYLFDPLKFLFSLPAEFEIYEKTRAIDIDCTKKVITTNGGKITAQAIIVATHYPIINFHGGYIFKLRQSESYLAAIDKQTVSGMYLDRRQDGLTLRPYLGGTLLGCADHRTGRGEGSHPLTRIREYSRKLFGTDELTHFWCAEDVMTADGMPMVGKYWADADGIFVITGFNKWGMTNAMVSASLTADMVLGKSNRFEALFAPDRRIPWGVFDYAKNCVVTATDVALGYFRLTFKTEKDIKRGSGAVVNYKGKKRAVYKDKDGKLYIIGRMCPHMHGELKWNKAAGCWECPCHGSRFDIHGNVISEPATKNCKCRTGK